MPAAQALDGLVSALFVPAGNRKLLISARDKGIKMVFIDLEDAIPPDMKLSACQGLAEDVTLLRPAVHKIAVRINRPWRMLMRDMEAAVAAGVDIVVVPKVEAAADIQMVSEILDEIAPGNGPIVLSIIESAKGLLAMPEIASSRPDRHAGIMLGPEDLALDLGAESSQDVMSNYAQALITAARSAGIKAIGSPGSVAEISDMETYRAQIDVGRRIGFDLVVAIHPRQLETIHEVFTPSSESVEKARRIVATDAESGGRPFLLDGKMIDAPIVARAKALLKLTSEQS